MHVNLFLKKLVLLIAITGFPCFVSAQNLVFEIDTSSYRQEIAVLEGELALKGIGNSRVYNLAAKYSLLGETEVSITYLQMAVDNGLLILNAIVDRDLKNVRTSEKWPAIRKKIIGIWYTYYPFGDVDYALDLVKMRENYIWNRQEIYKVEEEYGSKSDEYQKALGETQKIQIENGEKLDSLITLHGWPRQNLVGQAQTRAAALLMAFSDVTFQKKYLPEIENAVEYGELEGRYLAMITDKILISDGEKQLYGTQYLYNDSTESFDIAPIKNEADLDKRRLEMGLDSMDVYLKRLNADQD